jgi:endonuclease YncB( thermonuclease family)
VQTPPHPIFPAPGLPLPAPTNTRSDGHSKWRSFRALPILGQIGIWSGVALSTLLGVGMVGAIAAGPKAEPSHAVVAAAADTTELVTTTIPSTTTSTTSPATTIATTTIPATTVALTVPVVVVPATEAIVLLTAQVVDGDTITMSDGTTVRLIGIDTPERGQCGYDESSALLAQLLVGQNVTLVPGARDDIDKYGRLLRYVDVNGVDMDLKMIESGRAIARYDGRDGYGTHTRQDAYVQADDLSPSTNVCTPITVVPVVVVPPAAPSPTPAPEPTPAPASVHYQNCTEVRAAGAAPIYPGDPGFQSKFDRDNDGIGCE